MHATVMNDVPLSATIFAEARELLSVLRRNRRFGYILPFGSAVTSQNEHPLVKQLKALRDVIRIPVSTSGQTNPILNNASRPLLIPADVLLNAMQPIFEVIRSRDASSIITGAALQSLNRIATRLIHLADKADRLAEYATVLSEIVDAVAACRFDATDPASDEVVIGRILRVVVTICGSDGVHLLTDAAIFRGIEACLVYASGKRRASDLLKRTADFALVDVFLSLGRNLNTIASSSISVNHRQKLLSSNSKPPSTALETSEISTQSAQEQFVNSPTFPSQKLDSETLSQHGPASFELIVAVVQLTSRMADPFYTQSFSERVLGLQLLSTFISTAGPSLRNHLAVKKILIRDCARGILRSLGLFRSQPSIISQAFTISIQLVNVLEEDVAPFLLALLERVFPFYISGHENVLPKTGPTESELSGPNQSSNATSSYTNNTSTSESTANGSMSNTAGGAVDGEAIKIDPVIREIGLEALADLLSNPGLLCVVYQLSDCSMSRADVVQPLLQALGHAAKLSGSRRRSKRLHALNSGANIESETNGVDSDEEDSTIFSSSKDGQESSRLERSAALICADIVLSVVDTISDRLKLETAGVVKPPVVNENAFEQSRIIRSNKVRLQSAATAFNLSEKVGKASKLLALLREHGLAVSKEDIDGTVQEDLEDDVQSIVQFLRETPELRKDKIGNILGEPDNLSRKVLIEYTARFDFEGWQFTEALRVYLESFRLPGEAQKIDRIVQSFANRYYLQNISKDEPSDGIDGSTMKASSENTNKRADDELVDDSLSNGNPNVNQSVLKSADAAYVLSFSVVMLNTDQHNDSIRKRMSLEDFVKNCRGINDGEDLPKWFLAQVFDSIAAVEIRMSDEAGVGALTDLLWDEELRKADIAEHEFPITSESRIFDKQVFILTWEAGIIAANTILKEAVEPNSVQKALEGFLAMARCSTMFKMTRPINVAVLSLCIATTIREGPLYGAVVRFGTDIKAQMASVALSGVCRECGDWLRADGWHSLVAYFVRLHALCLLPNELEKKIGGYGSELVGIDKKPIKGSSLIPTWWPSCADSGDITAETPKPKTNSRPNGFFAAFLAASIGAETTTYDEDDEDGEDRDRDGGDRALDKFANGKDAGGRRRRRTSRSPPYYLRADKREDKEARELAKKCIASCRIEDIVVNEAKVLQWKSLQHLCEAVAQIAFHLVDSKSEQTIDKEKDKDEGTPKDDGTADVDDVSLRNQSNGSGTFGVGSILGGANVIDTESEYSSFITSSSGLDVASRERDERKASEFIIAFCVDVLCELTLQNRDRLNIPWPELHGLLVRIIAPATESLAVLERAIVALLRIGVRLLHRDELRDDVLRGFNLLVRLPAVTMEALCVPVAGGVLNIVKGHGAMIQSTSGWHAILSIVESLARYQTEARQVGLECIKWILVELNGSIAVSTKTYAPLLDAILAYTSSLSIDTSIEAMELLYMLSQCVASFTSKSVNEEEVWAEYWGPLFLGFASAVRDARGKVRNCAISTLERVIASRRSTELLTAEQWNRVLMNVVLPLMTQLFSTQGYFNATLQAERNAQQLILEGRGSAKNGGGVVVESDSNIANETSDNRKANGIGGRSKNRSYSISPEHESQLIKSVSAACSRTRMRAVMLTSKTFLLHHVEIAAGLDEERFTKLWMNVLEVFRVAVQPSSNVQDGKKGKGNKLNGATSTDSIVPDDDVTEHVPECVKNMLLVMCDSGLLTKAMALRWKATFSLVGEFIPDIEEIVCAATEVRSPRITATSSDVKVSNADVKEAEEGTAVSDKMDSGDAQETAKDVAKIDEEPERAKIETAS